MCIQEELGPFSPITDDPVLSDSHRVQIPNINSEGNTESSESTTKATVPPDTMYTQKPFTWLGWAGCIQPVLSVLSKLTFSERIKGNQSKLFDCPAIFLWLQWNEIKDWLTEILSFFVADDWEIPFEYISELQWLGSGAQGAVFSGKLKKEIVAVKKVREPRETDIRNLRKLNHPNIVQFKWVKNSHWNLVI